MYNGNNKNIARYRAHSIASWIKITPTWSELSRFESCFHLQYSHIVPSRAIWCLYGITMRPCPFCSYQMIRRIMLGHHYENHGREVAIYGLKHHFLKSPSQLLVYYGYVSIALGWVVPTNLKWFHNLNVFINWHWSACEWLMIIIHISPAVPKSSFIVMELCKSTKFQTVCAGDGQNSRHECVQGWETHCCYFE